MGARLPGGPRAALRYRRARAIRQPRDLACRRAALGARGVGISGARGGRALVPGARRRSSEEDAMTMIQSRAALLLPLLSIVARGTPLRAQTSTPHLGTPAAPTFVIHRVTEAPPLEAFLAGSAGAETSAVTDFRQREPGDGIPVSQRTTAYLSYDDVKLYVVFVCWDDPARVRANVARRDDISHDDHVMVYLDTFHDRKRAFRFAVNPFGVQQDGILTDGQSEDLSFDAVWSSEGRMTDSGYVVRMAIPFRSLRFSNDSVQTWGIALGRAIRRENERSYWPHITKGRRGFVSQLGTLQGLAGISPGRNVQVNPYSVLARARILDEGIPGHVTQGDERIGADAKLILHDAYTLDATANPDFSQVETDDPQVTLNQRFEVFFAEKRPFFLENAGFFQTPVPLLFSRRVVDPAAGLRLTGKASGWAMGAFAMNDRAPLPSGDPDAGRDAWIGAARLQRELGKESTVGLLATDREFLHSANAELMRRESVQRDGTRSGDWGALGEVSFNSRPFDYKGIYQEFGPAFSAPLGFVNRVGFRRTEQGADYTVRLKSGPVTTLGPAVSVDAYWDHETGQLLDRDAKAQFLMQLRGNSKVLLNRHQSFELFEGPGIRPEATEAEVGSEWVKWLGLTASYIWGTAVNHDPAAGVAPSLARARQAVVKVTLRPTSQLRLDQSYNYVGLRTSAGSRIVGETQFREKLNYQFTALFSLRAIVDWTASDADTTLSAEDARQRKWGIDVLFTYLAHPGTALYLGYTDRYENLQFLPGPPRELGPSRSPDMSVGRQFFVKASYLLRF